MQDVLNLIKEQGNNLAQGQFSFGLYLIISGGAVLLIFISSLVLSVIRRKRLEEEYIENFKQEFTGNIRTTLQALQKDYKKGTDMWIGINKALFYLEHSIRREYEGALWYIDTVTESDNVRSMQREYLCKIPGTYQLTSQTR